MKDERSKIGGQRSAAKCAKLIAPGSKPCERVPNRAISCLACSFPAETEGSARSFRGARSGQTADFQRQSSAKSASFGTTADPSGTRDKQLTKCKITPCDDIPFRDFSCYKYPLETSALTPCPSPTLRGCSGEGSHRMPPQYIFEMHDVGKRYGERVVLNDINLSFYYGAKIGIVGENGAGQIDPARRSWPASIKDIDGTAALARNMRVRYVAQEPQLDLDKTVRENLRTAMKPVQDLVDRFNEITMEMADPKPDDDLDKLMEEMGRLQEKIDACDGWELDRLMDIASDALVLPPDDTPVRQLSGGERRRVALCMALLEKPDLLLLDEPTNHLDAETVQWLEQTLREYPGTVIIVTHDRYFLDNITKWILELENGRGLPFEGNYSSWLAAEGRTAASDREARDRSGRGPCSANWTGSATRTKAGGRRTRPASRPTSNWPPSRWTTPRATPIIQIATGPRLGDKVLTFHDVSKAFMADGEKLNLMENCSFDVPRGGIVGVIGPNGTGKTTLFRMVVGQEEPDAGPHRTRPERAAFLRRSAPRRPGRQADRLRGDHRRQGHDRAGQHPDELAGLSRPVQLPRPARSRSWSASAPAASGTASTWPKCSAAAATSSCWTSRRTTWT